MTNTPLQPIPSSQTSEVGLGSVSFLAVRLTEGIQNPLDEGYELYLAAVVVKINATRKACGLYHRDLVFKYS